jgi:hypothetical protein
MHPNSIVGGRREEKKEERKSRGRIGKGRGIYPVRVRV